MSLIPYYLRYLTEICEGTRQAPAGICLTQTDDLKKAIELQSAVSAMGVPDFVRACAMQDGLVIPEEEYASFRAEDLNEAVSVLAGQAEETPEEKPEPAPSEPVPTETRDIYEVFLDSVCLEDDLLVYLIDILKRGAKEEFAKLSHAAARTLIDMDDFMAWLGNKELIASAAEHGCAVIMDGCLDRLVREGKAELAAALLSGDETTYCVFRAEAPELVHVPEATYEWFCTNYLDRYYPVRFFMKRNGVVFPRSDLADCLCD